MWKLVAVTISLGLVITCSSNPTDRTEKNDVIRKNAPFFFSRPSEAPPEPQFLCHKKPQGFYADPRFQCEVFHYCHSDGTRVTIPCHRDDQQHRICLLKDLASKACDGSAIYLALPEDLYFKGSKDTTASALNGATEYKLSDVLPEPTPPPEDIKSTTPLDSDETPLSSKDVSSVYEVFNSFLKEIRGAQQLETRSERFLPRPSTFSRGSRVPPALEQKDSLIDIAPAVIDRRVDNGAYLVEVYNHDGEEQDTDYSAYRRKSKKLFFSSDKKSPAKHPRRRKRTVGDQRAPGRPYAIIYAKVPDTTLASSGNGHSERQDQMEFTYGQGLIQGKTPMIPVTIETHRKKPKQKPTTSEQDQRGVQQTSEQQNIYYYAPDQGVGPDGRGIVDPRLRSPESVGQQPRQNPQLQQTDPQNNRQSPYAPQSERQLQLPNFPFQSQPYLNTQRPPFYFDPQAGYQPYGSLGQFQGPPQQPETAVPQQSPRPSNQPSRQREPTNRPTETQGGSGTSPRDRIRSSLSSRPQGFSGYPFFQNFPGFDEFTNSFSQRDPSPFNLLQPIQQQPPPGSFSQPPQQFFNQGRPSQDRPQPQSIQSHPGTEAPRPGISLALQPGRDPSAFGQGIPQQDRTRQPLENSHPPSQRPSGPRGRPDEHVPVIVQEIRSRPQSTRQPPSNPNAPDRPRQRPTPYDHRVIYQPEYSPEGVVIRPNGPSVAPIREAVPHDGDNRPLVLIEDFREPSPPSRPYHVENDQREVVHPQRPPVPERERQRHPEHDRNRDERPRRPEGNRNQERPRRPEAIRNPPRPQSSNYFTPTAAPQSSRPRTRTRQPTRNEHRVRPEEESGGGRNHIEEHPEFGHRRPPPPEERPVQTRPSPEGIPVDNRFFNRPQNRRPSSDAQDTTRSPRPTRPRTTQGERPRHRPQPQIERPPSEYVLAEPLPETYDGHQGYFSYPPQGGNDINGISTVDDSISRPRTPPTIAIRQPVHRGSIRNSQNPEIEGGFIPMTEAPGPEPNYRTRPSSKEYGEPIEDHRRPEKLQSNRYQDVDNVQTTRHPETTRRPTPKRKPPPKPTFPPFPTFPPPPRRPITSPRPNTESSEYRKEGDGTSDSRTSEPNPEYSPTSINQPDAILEPDHSLNRDSVTEGHFQTTTPEVSTRRRTRKRKPRPRRPKPTAPYIEDDQTPGETVTQPTTVRDTVTYSSPRVFNARWQQQSTSNPRSTSTEATTTPASAKSEEFGSRINLFGRQRPRKPVGRGPSTTQTTPLLKEESVRVSNVPTRGRKAFAKRMRVKTTTTTETPETDNPIARSDENTEFLSYQSDDDASPVTIVPEFESSTFFPSLESMTGVAVSTTESYNEMVETTDESTTSGFDVYGTDMPQEDPFDDFESTRSIRKKFQNRPRVLKFGKPKLRSTLSPLDLNAAESRV